MVGEATVGPDAQLERLLEKYDLDADSWAADLAENDTDRLLMALLLEQRGQDVTEAISGSGPGNGSGVDDTDATSAVGTDEAAELSLGGAGTTEVDLYYQVATAGDIRVEVSTDGTTWRRFDTISPDGADSDIYQFETTYPEVRVYADRNTLTDDALGVLELVSSRGGS